MKPPGAVLIPIAYGAGLATGLARFGAPGWMGLIAMTAWLTQVGRLHATFLPFVALLGAASGLAARVHEAGACMARLVPGPVSMDVRLLEPVDSGGMALVVPRGVSCRGPLTARFSRRTSLEAGTIVQLLGTWRADLPGLGKVRGMLRVDDVRVLQSRPDAGTRVRNEIGKLSARLYGSRAPLVDALVVGRRSDMDAGLKSAFANSGLVHLLSISGFHIGVLTLWCGFLLRRLRLGRVRALAISSALGTAYVAFLGWPAPAVRAIALAWCLTWLRWRQRAVLPDALLATTALFVLLLDPWAVIDLGAWLSVLSLWGAVRFARWAAQAGGCHWVAQGAASSVGATVATAPLTALALGAVAPVGIVLNFIAIPLAAIAVPGVLVSLLAGLVAPPLAIPLAAGSGLVLHGLELVAQAGAMVPLGHQLGQASQSMAAPWALLLVVLVWATPRQGKGGLALHRLAVVGVGLSWASLAPRLPLPSAHDGQTLALHFLDVGQGDAALIRTPRGHLVVIDAGPRGDQFDAGAARVVPAIRRSGGQVDLMLLSHAHADHMGGAPSVLREVPVGLVVEPAIPSADPAYRALLDAVARSGARWRPGRMGQEVVIDSVSISLLLPDTTWGGWGLDLNEGSLVALVQYRDFRALLAGDAGWAAESLLAGRVGPVDVLKVGHHGSRTATGGCFLAESSPAVAVISVGRQNRYGHPAPGTLRRLGTEQASVWRTDLEGAIDVLTDGRRFTVRARARREEYVSGAASTIQESRGFHAHCRDDD